MPRKIVLVFLLVCFGFTGLRAQYTIQSAKAIRAYEKALELYRAKQAETALEKLDIALKTNSGFIEAWLLRGDILHDLNREEEEMECYRKAMEIDSAFFPNTYLYLGNVHYSRGEYTEALKAYEGFLAQALVSSPNRKLALKRIGNCRFAQEAISHPVDFRPVNLGDSINTRFDEYWPVLTADEEMLIFTALVPDDTLQPSKTKHHQEDFYVSTRHGTHWKKARPLAEQLNSEGNEGAQSLTADGRYLYFTACNRDDGLGRCDIYYSVRNGNQWSAPVNMGAPVNSAGWEAQPSISADGRVLYFVSNREGGKGKMDIWRSELREVLMDGRQLWSQPENLAVNTGGNEMSPFIHADNATLFFASDELTGMGGHDLFQTRRLKGNTWSEPVNLGYPVNTHANETGITVTARGNKAYFSSARLKGRGRDIYTFDLPRELQPKPVSYLKGKIFDIRSEAPVQANLELTDLESGDTVARLQSDAVNGNYLVCLPSGGKYAFNASAPGYLFYSGHFSLKKEADIFNPRYRDIGLKPVEKGETVVLRNVFFDADSWELKPESQIELEKLVLLLQNHALLHMEIGGHTDSTGTEGYNRKLSENRARAVQEFLLGKGIAAERLTYKGYGYSRPVASNKTEAGKAKNRRTEFKILKTVIHD